MLMVIALEEAYVNNYFGYLSLFIAIKLDRSAARPQYYYRENEKEPRKQQLPRPKLGA
jgi:hypothetical protein